MLTSLALAADGRLRIGYRLALYGAAFAVASVAGGLSRQGLLALHAPHSLAALALAAVTIGLQLWLTRLLRRHVDRRPVEGLALGSLRRGWPRAVQGFAAASLMLLGVLGVQLALGWVTIEGVALPGGTLASALDQLAGVLFLFVAVGFAEELLMRGAVLQNLGEVLPLWAAVAVSGALFGLAHAATFRIGPAFVLSAVVLTAMLAVARLYTGTIWWAIGGHAAWDWLQETVLGLSLQAGMTHSSVLQLRQRGPAAWVGVPPALEGGLLYILVEALGLGALLWLARRSGLSPLSRLAPDGQVERVAPPERAIAAPQEAG
jgi:membrane protease YdiL (CAAX protease family)